MEHRQGWRCPRSLGRNRVSLSRSLANKGAMLSVSHNTKPPRIHKSSNLVKGLVDEIGFILWVNSVHSLAIATMVVSIAMIATWLDILNCSGKQHDPFEKCCLQGASSFVHVLTFHCGKTCNAGLAYTCAECVQWSGSCWNPIEDGANGNSGGGRQERPSGSWPVFWFLKITSSPAVSKPQHKVWRLSPCSTLLRLDACHCFVEKRPVPVCSTCSPKKMSRIHAGSFQPLREKHLGTKSFSECYFGISSLFSSKFTPSTLFSARLKIQHCCFRTLVAMQSLLTTSFTPCWTWKTINRSNKKKRSCGAVAFPIAQSDSVCRQLLDLIAIKLLFERNSTSTSSFALEDSHMEMSLANSEVWSNRIPVPTEDFCQQVPRHQGLFQDVSRLFIPIFLKGCFKFLGCDLPEVHFFLTHEQKKEQEKKSIEVYGSM